MQPNATCQAFGKGSGTHNRQHFSRETAFPLLSAGCWRPAVSAFRTRCPKCGSMSRSRSIRRAAQRGLHSAPNLSKLQTATAMRGRLQIRATRWTFVDRAGNYSVVVANSMGSVTSAPVVLTVNCALTRPPRMAGRFPNIPICRVSRRTPS